MQCKEFILKNIWILLFVYFFLAIKYPVFGIVAVICMLAPIITSMFWGRKWCGYFCPRGNFNDQLLSKISLKKKYPIIFKKTWFRVLFLVLLMGSFVVQLTFAKDLNMLGLVFLRMVIATTIITVILGIIYKHRAWCMFCPMGTIATWISSISMFSKNIKNIMFEKSKCVSCNVCENACPMEITITEHDEEIKDSNCIKCSNCVFRCKKEALKF